MKRLFITTFFPSSNVPASSTSCSSKSLPSSSAGGLDLIEQILQNKGIPDSVLIEINDVSTLRKLALENGLPFEPLQKYQQKLLKNKPIRHNSNQASILTSRSSSLLSSFMNDSYLEDSVGLDDEATIYSSRSASISIPSSHSSNSTTSTVKSFGATISSSIDEHFFDEDGQKMRKPTPTTATTNIPVNYEETTTTTLSQEEKAKKELENILDIIHDNNHSFPKSALVAAFRKTINEGRLPSSPALNPSSPVASPEGYKSFMFNDIDSEDCSDFDSPTSPVL